jgi:hypothetical protein
MHDEPQARPASSLSRSSARARLAWCAAVAVTALATAMGAEALGRSSRVQFTSPPEFEGRRWATVSGAADAVRVWAALGVHGRKLVVLSGRWGRTDLRTVGRALADGGEGLDADTALLAAARLGIAREVHVAMPPAAFQRRFLESVSAKGAEAGEGWISHPYQGFRRRFSLLGELAPLDEPVLVLVEPSFFDASAPGQLREWLARRATVDLGIVALDDPAATDAQRELARSFAEALRALGAEPSG